MYALQLASEAPSELVDWNNNYGERMTSACCSLRPLGQKLLQDIMISTAPTLGQLWASRSPMARCWRTPAGRDICRVSKTRMAGSGLHGSGAIHHDPLATFGNRAVGRSQAYRAEAYICKNASNTMRDERVA